VRTHWLCFCLDIAPALSHHHRKKCSGGGFFVVVSGLDSRESRVELCVDVFVFCLRAQSERVLQVSVGTGKLIKPIINEFKCDLKLNSQIIVIEVALKPITAHGSDC
jgi:hypothetical protein